MDLTPIKSYLKVAELAAAAALAIYLASWHYGKVHDADQGGYDRATGEMQVKVNELNQKTLELEAKQKQSEHDAETYHAQLVESGKRTTDSISVSLHDIEESLRRGLLSGSMGGAAKPDGAGGSPGGAGELQSAISAFIDAAKVLSTSCSHDSAELVAVLDLARKNGSKP